MTYEQAQEAYRDAQTMERWSILSDNEDEELENDDETDN